MASLINNLRKEKASMFYKNVDSIFSELVSILGANCGILVLREEDNSFLEYSSFGYESDFYYSFLARGNGQFELIASSEEPVQFDFQNFSLYNPKSSSAVAIRVCHEKEMIGFILVEFEKQIGLLQKEFMLFVSDKIASIHAGKLNLINLPIVKQEYAQQERSICFEVFDFLLNESIGFTNSLKANRFLNIQGSAGAGKKSLVKYIYKKLDFQGKLIYLNSLPEQIVKLEKAISDWIVLAENGILVIENISRLTMGQQRIFLEFIKQPILQPRIIFLDDLTRPIESYEPFQILLSQHTTQLPNLLSLDKNKLRNLIDILFKHLRQINHRPDMVLADDVYEFLFDYPFKENIRDLRNLLEQAIISSKENIIKKEFYLKLNNSKIKSLDFLNEEDLDLRKSVQALERQKILLANKIFAGNQIRMAKALGISRGSLQYKMKQLEL